MENINEGNSLIGGARGQNGTQKKKNLCICFRSFIFRRTDDDRELFERNNCRYGAGDVI